MAWEEEGVMKLEHDGYTVKLTIGDVSVWMAALYQACKESKVEIFPADSCPFYLQHRELVRMTGFNEWEQGELDKMVQEKNEKRRGSNG